MSILLDMALKLPIPERIELVGDIWDSIAAEPRDLELTPEQETELARRIEDCRENPEGNFSWEEVRDAALAR